MRILAIVAAAALGLGLAATTASDAEARGRRISLGGVWTAARPANPPRPAATAAAPVLVATAGPSGASEGGGLRRSLAEEAKAEVLPEAKPTSVTAAAPVVAPVKSASAASSWCARGRVVGAGAGFCEIN